VEEKDEGGGWKLEEKRSARASHQVDHTAALNAAPMKVLRTKPSTKYG
jgi:hypothetical protein